MSRGSVTANDEPLSALTSTRSSAHSGPPKIAFPDGSMTASGLRKEAARGRLTIWRVANKDYTSLVAIRDMMDKCRTEPKAHVSISETATEDRRFGKSVTDRTESALNALLLTVN